MIDVEKLTRRFHDLVAVDDISLHVGEGDVLGFLGPNGAGKTTTLRILTGFLPATSGRASVAGYDVATQSLAVRRRIGYLPENVPLPLDARVDEYLEYRARLKGIDGKRRGDAKARVLGLCGLEDMSRRIVGQLSRGYRQRVGLADALIADPPVLILDEPTGGLDPAQRQDVLDLVAGLQGRRTVILSSHVLAEVEDSCSRVAIIKRGRIVADGTRDELEQSVGARDEVLVAARGAADRLTAALIARGVAFTPADAPDAVIASDVGGPGLLSELVGEGIPVTRFEPRSRSLQELFLEMIRDDGEAAP